MFTNGNVFAMVPLLAVFFSVKKQKNNRKKNSNNKKMNVHYNEKIGISSERVVSLNSASDLHMLDKRNNQII